MSSKPKMVDEGGQKGPSESVFDSPSKGVQQLMLFILKSAIDRSDEVSPEAKVQIDLRSQPERMAYLENLIGEVCPDGVDPDLWARWLQGGQSPFPAKLSKVGVGDERPVQTVTRSVARVRTQSAKVARMRAKLEAEEEELKFLKAHQNGAVHWQVFDSLVSIMSATFAMGPAWTLMRAISGYMSDEEISRMTPFLDGDERASAAERYRAEKQEESDEILNALDLWSGDQGFENDLRSAIKGVVSNYEGKGAGRVQNGRRRRSAAEVKNSVNPEAKADSKKVLSGLKDRTDPFA